MSATEDLSVGHVVELRSAFNVMMYTDIVANLYCVLLAVFYVWMHFVIAASMFYCLLAKSFVWMYIVIVVSTCCDSLAKSYVGMYTVFVASLNCVLLAIFFCLDVHCCYCQFVLCSAGNVFFFFFFWMYIAIVVSLYCVVLTMGFFCLFVCLFVCLDVHCCCCQFALCSTGNVLC